MKEENENIEVFSTLNQEINTVLIYSKNDFINSIVYAKENYEIVKILNIWNCLSLDDIDLEAWDIIVPNTFINKDNKAVFLEYLIDKEYDLKNYWLILNWISLSLDEDLKDEEDLLKIKEKYLAEVIDNEAFNIAKSFKDNDLSDKGWIIKIIWKDKDFISNWVDILELML